MGYPASSIQSTCGYAAKLVPISDAQARCFFSRTDFYRFRQKHKIGTQPGRRLMVDDIVEAFEGERAGHCRDAKAAGTVVLTGTLDEYVKKLIPLTRAAEIYGFSEISFWRFRLAHGIQKLSGQRVHEDDLIAAFEAQRKGTTLKTLKLQAALAAPASR